jgi:hypothetical protein
MDFDPYKTWLGIPADRRPPTYYDLLGLAPYESDPTTIDRAALRRMGKVRQYQLGPQSDLGQEVLAELARARLILMDPDRRADYDAKLRARGESRPGPSAAPEKVRSGDASQHRSGLHEDAPDVLASLVITERANDGPLSPHSVSNKGPSRRNKGLVLGAFLASDAVLVGVFFYCVFGPTDLKPKPPVPNRVDPPAAVAQEPKRPALPPKPVIKMKPEAPPPIIAQRQADPPAGGDVPEPKPPAEASPSPEPPSAPKKPDRAPEDFPEQRLKDLGLVPKGSLYVLQRESNVRDKLREAESSFDEYKSAFERMSDIQIGQARIRDLSQYIRVTLDHDIDVLDMMLRNQPPFLDNLQKAEIKQARAQRETLDRERIEDRSEISLIQSRLPNFGVIQQLDAEIARLRQTCDSMVGEVRNLINSTSATYDKLEKNDDAKAALRELEGRSKAKLKLKIGRSREYKEMDRRTRMVTVQSPLWHRIRKYQSWEILGN